MDHFMDIFSQFLMDPPKNTKNGQDPPKNTEIGQVPPKNTENGQVPPLKILKMVCAP